MFALLNFAASEPEGCALRKPCHRPEKVPDSGIKTIYRQEVNIRTLDFWGRQTEGVMNRGKSKGENPSGREPFFVTWCDSGHG
jgi:hypothetical protein